MNRITFCGGESTGSVADRKIETAKNESTGGVGVRVQDKTSEIRTLDKDTINFRGRNYSDKNDNSKFALTAIGTGFAATAFIAGLGFAQKYKWVDKISNPKIKDFVVKYGTEPSYKLLSSIKSFLIK